MKCTNCGNTELFQTQAILILYGSGSVNADIYACNRCGHVEMFVPQKTIDNHNKMVEEAKKQECARIECEQEIKKIQAKMEELKTIIQDENQTVKSVNAAKQEYEEYNKKLNSLIASHSSMRVARSIGGIAGSKGDG